VVQKRRRVATDTASAGGNKFCTCGKCPARTQARYCPAEGGLEVCGHGIRKSDCLNATCNPKQAQMCSECTSECGTYKSGCARKEIGSCITAKGLGYPMCGCGSRKADCKKRKPHCPFRNPKPEA
jgi:hypothetical protein